MKKILIVINNMHIGGIQKALINLLKEINNKYDITLFILYPQGELMKDIPSNIKIIEGNKFTQILGMSQKEAKQNGLFCWIWRSFWVIITKIFGFKISIESLSKMQKIKQTYDYVISYSQNSSFKQFYSGCNEIALYSVNGLQKISFVHCDFEHYEGNCPYNKNLYYKFDKIACVSESVKKIMEKEIPEIKNKLYTVHNCYDFELMEKLSKEQVNIKKTSFMLFSSARFTPEKGIEDILPTMVKLKNLGYNFLWVIAGNGPEFNKIKKDIENLKLQNNIILLGYKYNPYPYFKLCDAVLVPSREEAAPMVFGEAKYFNKTIITTNTLSAFELVTKENAGYVCSQEQMFDIIAYILDYKKALKTNQKISNTSAIEEFVSMVNM